MSLVYGVEGVVTTPVATVRPLGKPWVNEFGLSVILFDGTAEENVAGLDGIRLLDAIRQVVREEIARAS